ncbi:MAG: hypothetical protein M1561_00425 [Gammaproteobacteria bacterium]|nr:hypothetical protein [Gammaproteobacteria bacterium]
MKFIIKILSIATLAAMLTCCTTTTIVPQVGNMYIISAMSTTEAGAANAVIKKAKGMCESEKGNVKVIDQDTIYQGVDVSQQALINLANKVLPSNKTEPPSLPPDHAYKSTLTFKCEGE